MYPLVSVLIPAYNCVFTVERAVDSILRQTLRNIEVLVVDDGSDDATPEVLDRMKVRDSRLRVIPAPHNGIVAALNAGLQHCRADLIARMDADDISHPRRLEHQADFMRLHPGTSVCSTLVRMFPRAYIGGGMLQYEQWLNSLVSHEDIVTDMFVESPLAHPSAMVRRQELIDLGGYRDLGWPEDYDLWLRYHAANKQFAKLPQTLLFWRQGEGRLTFCDSRYSVENFLRAKAHFLALVHKDSGRPLLLWGAGKTGRRISKHLIREGLPIHAVIDIDPAKIGRTLRGAPIVPVSYLREHRDGFIIAAVSSHGSRQLIRESLDQMGFVEMRDFICAA